MALNATIHKVELSVSDMDRHYYETHKLTVAKHPSETHERMMLRLVAFAMMAHDQLEMTKGLSTDDEPDIWRTSLSGELELSVLLGQPSEKVIRQTCNKSRRVLLCTYGGRAAEIWWEKIRSSTTRFGNLTVVNFSETATAELAEKAGRSMRMQVNIQDAELMVSVDDAISYITPVIWQQSELAEA
jgi:uncharacterized protein YaeQ